MLLFISFSVKHSAWCIVTWPRLMEEIRKGYSIPIEIRAMKTMFGMLVQDGYLSLPRPDGWFERLFGQEMVYPTKALFDVVSRAMAKSDAD